MNEKRTSFKRQGKKGKLTIFFDGSCKLCKTEIDFYRRRNKEHHFQFVDISCRDTNLPNNLTRERARERFHVLKSDNTLISGVQAFAEIWSYLDGWRWLACVVSVPIITTVLEQGYHFFLKYRKLFVMIFIKFNNLRSHFGKSN